MPRILLDVTDEDLHEVLEEYMLEFEDADVATVFTDDKGGAIKEVKDLELVLYKTPDVTVCIFPLDDVMYEEVLNRKAVLKAYSEFITTAKDDHPVLVQRFRDAVAALMDPELWVVEVPALLLEDTRQTMQVKDGAEVLRVRSYLFHKETRGGDVVRFDTRSVHTLCNSVIDMDHLLTSLKPSMMVNVLMTVFEKDDKVVAIRVTKLRGGTRAEIKGAYACSKGYGKLIQQWTEGLLRRKGATLFPHFVATKQPVVFKLAALPSAVGFWKHVGFQEVGKTDKENHLILTKPLYTADEVEVLRSSNKRQRSSAEEGVRRSTRRK